MKIKFKKLPFWPIILVLISIIICIKNYSFNTWLIGWDNLHPEFNFSLAFSRVLNGVWRADQGLGSVAIHSHYSELPRLFILWISSLVLPDNFLRWFYFFMALIFGPLGVYKLTNYLFKNSKIGLLAGAVYLMNLGTLQHFVLPFEMFASQYCFLPWIFLAVFKFLYSNSKKWLIFFSLLVFFASSQAYAATLFYSFFACFLVFLATYLLLMCSKLTKERDPSISVGMTKGKNVIANKAGQSHWASEHSGGIASPRFTSGLAMTLFILTLFINSYWLLPNLYAVKTHGLEVKNSKVNRMFSPEAFAKNQLFGDFKDAVIFKNFLFDWELYDFNKNPQEFVQVLQPWINHLKNPIAGNFGYLVFAFSILGIIKAIKERNKILLSILPVYIISFGALLNGTWPISLIFNKLSDFSPLLSEALRFPFTKFSILFMFCVSVFFANGIVLLFSLFKTKKIFQTSFTFIFMGLLVFSFLPAFKGNLISPAMKIKIPSEYFEMFSFFNKQDKSGRVAILPIHSFWNWTYNSWGYQGAGFLQFGIFQPILDRDYDRWNIKNEQYQREMAYAVYSGSPELLKAVLNKFQVKWVLFDQSVKNIGGRDEETYKWAIPGMLERTGIVKEAKKFDESLIVYEITSERQEIKLYKNLQSTGPKLIGSPEDTEYVSLGNYITSNKENDFFNNFRSGFITTERFILENIEKKPVAIFSNASSGAGELKIENPLGYKQIINDFQRFQTTSGSFRDYIAFPEIPHNKAYLVEIQSRNIGGFPLQICISEPFSRHCQIYVHLEKNKEFIAETFFLPPLSDWTLGYTINFNNFAIKNQTTVNDLKTIIFYEIPYDGLLSKVIFSNLGFIKKDDYLKADFVKKNNWLYKVSLNNSDKKEKILTLNQSYEDGWVAAECTMYPLKRAGNVKCKILNKVLFNNWANGWELTGIKEQETRNSPETNIYIFFWPQILQYLGFILLGGSFLFVLLKKK